MIWTIREKPGVGLVKSIWKTKKAKEHLLPLRKQKVFKKGNVIIVYKQTFVNSIYMVVMI